MHNGKSNILLRHAQYSPLFILSARQLPGADKWPPRPTCSSLKLIDSEATQVREHSEIPRTRSSLNRRETQGPLYKNPVKSL